MKLILLLILLILAGCQTTEEKTLIVACPSMVALTEGFESDTIAIVRVETSAHAFEAVRSGRADAALTGRPPTPIESNGHTSTIRTGSTLLSDDSRVVLVSDLSELDVAICVNDYPEGIVRPLPCESYPDETAHRIIDWESWNEEPFVTVIDGASKSILFRGAYLTSREEKKTVEAVLKEHLRGAP